MEVAPWLPHITLEQNQPLASALLKVNPAETSIIAGAAREVLASLLRTKE